VERRSGLSCVYAAKTTIRRALHLALRDLIAATLDAGVACRELNSLTLVMMRLS
jgi:hypothetical protein